MNSYVFMFRVANDRFEESIKLIFRLLIPLVLLICGVILLVAQVSFLTTLFGIPVTVIGISLVIFAYDEAVNKTFPPTPIKVAACMTCGKMTPIFNIKDLQDPICIRCKINIAKGINTEIRRRKLTG